jgi:hypothetical protein
MACGNGNGTASPVRVVNMEFHGAAGSDASAVICHRKPAQQKR